MTRTPPRVFVVGTDTGVGKTTLVCTLLQQARTRGIVVLPFKPAQSGADPLDPTSDAGRLATAAGLPDARDLCPLWYAAPLAPGIAASHDAHDDAEPDPRASVSAALDRLVATHRPELVLVEGAGGLIVPMPGDTWQPDWIAALADRVVIVARAGLGTINHTMLTVEALRLRALQPIGIYLNETDPPDPSNRDNASVLAHASGLPVLATVPHGLRDVPDLLAPLFAAL